jgi:hypothetical protein
VFSGETFSLFAKSTNLIHSLFLRLLFLHRAGAQALTFTPAFSTDTDVFTLVYDASERKAALVNANLPAPVQRWPTHLLLFCFNRMSTGYLLLSGSMRLGPSRLPARTWKNPQKEWNWLAIQTLPRMILHPGTICRPQRRLIW